MVNFGLKYQYTHANQRREIKITVVDQSKKGIKRDEALKKIDEIARAEIEAGTIKDSKLSITLNDNLELSNRVNLSNIKDVSLIPDGPILEHFAKVNTTCKICQLIQRLFEQVEYFFHCLTGYEAKRCANDFELLSSLAEEYPLDGKLEMKTCLTYMKRQLENEKGPKDLELINRLGYAEKIATKVTSMRGIKKPTKSLKALVNEIQTDIKGLKPGKKLLIPLSYQEVRLDPKTEKSVDLWHQFVLEVEGREEGKCAIRLVTNNPNFQKELACKTEENKSFFNLFHTQENIDINLLAKRMEPLFEVQVWDRMGFYNSRSFSTMLLNLLGLYPHTIDNTPLFKDLLSFEGATLNQTQPQEWTREKAQGPIKELMVYLKAERPLDHKYLEVSSHLEIFLKVAERNDNWLKKEEFRGIALASINKLLIETYENREILFGLDKEAQEKGIKEIVSRLKVIKDKAEKYATKDKLPIGKSFTKVLEGKIYLPEPIRIALEESDKKEPIVPSYVPSTSVATYDPNDPVGSLRSWNQRCNELLEAKQYGAIQEELILMAEQIPLSDKSYVIRKNVWKNEKQVMDLIDATLLELDLTGISSYKFKEHVTLLNYQLGQVPTERMKKELESFCKTDFNRTKINKLQAELEKIYQVNREEWKKSFEENNQKINLITEQLTPLINNWFISYNKTANYKSALPPQQYLALQTFGFVLHKLASNYIDKTANGFDAIPSFHKLFPGDQHTLSLKDSERNERMFKEVSSLYNYTSSMSLLSDYGTEQEEYYKANDPNKAPPKLTPAGEQYKKKNPSESNWTIAAMCDVGDLSSSSLPKPLAAINRLFYLRSIFNAMQKGLRDISPQTIQPLLLKCDTLSFTINPLNRCAESTEQPHLCFMANQRCQIQNTLPEHYSLIPTSYDSELEKRVVLKEHILPIGGKKTTNGIWTEEEARDIASCNHSFLESNYHQLFNVFSIHPQFFGRPECQKLFKNILYKNFSTTYFKLQDIRSFVDKIPSLIEQFKRNNDVRAAVFLLEISDTIQRHFDYPSDVIGKLYDLAKLFKDPDQQRLIHMQILNIYNEDLLEKKIKCTDLNFEEIFKSYLLVESEPATPKWEDPAQVFGYKQLIYRVLPYFKQKSDVEKLQIVNAVMKGFTQSQGEWQLAPGGFPAYISGNQYLDLSKGLYLIDGKKSGHISAAIRTSALFEEFFKDQDDMLCSISLEGSKLIYTPIQQPNYRLVLDGGSVYLFHKIKVNGSHQWCQYISTRDITKSLQTSKYEMPKLDFKTVLNAVKEHFFPSKKPIDAVNYIKEAAIGNKDCWRSVQDPEKIFVAEREGDCVASLTVKKNKDKNDYSLISWTKANGDSLLNTFDESDSLKRFNPLESAEHILCYGKKGTIDLVEFPRLTVGSTSEFLSFCFTKTNKVELQGSKGFYLCESDQNPGNPHSKEVAPVFKPGFKNFMLFENQYREQKVIIACREIEKRHGGEWETMLTQKADRTAAAFEFVVDQATNLLRSNSDEGNLYLSYVHFAQKDYLKALTYLHKANPKGEIVNWIRNWPDENFNALVFKIEMERMLIKNPSTAPQMREECVTQYAKISYKLHKLIASDKSLLKTFFASYLPSEYENLEILELASVMRIEKSIIESTPFNRLPKGDGAAPPKPFPSELSTFALTLWSESQPFANKLPNSFQLAGREFLISHFFVLAEMITKLDVKSTEYVTLIESIERFTKNMENDQNLSTDRLEFEEAKYLLLKLRDERSEGKEDLFKAIQEYHAELKKLTPDNFSTKIGDAYLSVRDGLKPVGINLTIESPIPASRSNRIAHYKEALNISNRLIYNKYFNHKNLKVFDQEIQANVFNYGKKYFGSIYEPMRKISTQFLVQTPLKAEPKNAIERKTQDLTISFTKPPTPRAEMLKEKIARLQETLNRSVARANPIYSSEPVKKGPLLPVEPFLSAVREEERKIVPSDLNKIFNSLEAHEEPAVRELAFAHRQDTLAILKTPAIKIAPYTKVQLEGLKKKLEEQKAASTVTRDTLYATITHELKKTTQSSQLESLKGELGYTVTPSVELILSRTEENPKAREYLINATLINQTEKAYALVTEALESLMKSETLDEVRSEELHSCLTATRCYDEMRDPIAPDLLIMEYKLGILLRPEQKEMIEMMLQGRNLVRQLKMGDGKTMVILPFLAKRKATGKNLVAVLLPKKLYQMGKSYLSQVAIEVWGQKAYGFEFDINTTITEESLLTIEAALLETIIDKGFIVSTNESFLSFRNTYIALSLQLAKDPDDSLFKKVQIIARISKMLKEECDVIADEVDIILDNTKEVNFSIGEQTNLEPLHLKVSVDLMRYIFTSNDEKLKLLAESLKHDAQATLTSEQRSGALESLVREVMQTSDPQVIHYMMGRDDEVHHEPFLNKFDNFEYIATVREFISKGFTDSLKKSHSTTIGYGRDEKGLWTIPYSKGEPNKGAEIYLPVPRVCATLQDYISSGVTFDQIKGLKEEAMVKARAEILASWQNHTMTLDETVAGKEFIALIEKMNHRLDKKEKLPLTLQFFKTRQIRDMQRVVNKNPLSMMDYCEYILLPRMLFSPIQIPGTPYDLLEMVHTFMGFSGTPWNSGSYSQKIDAETRLGVEGKSYQVLLEMNPTIRVVDLEEGHEITSLLQKCGFSKNYQALIDLGGYLKGKRTIDFVEAAEEQAHGEKIAVKGYMYVDDNTGDLVFHPSGQKKAIAHTQAQNIDPIDRKSIYVQAATTGTDIPQDKEAIALVTIGEETYIRDLFQAIWRLRKLDKFQKVEFLVSNKVKNLIGYEVKLEDILKFCIINQGLKVGTHNLRGDLSIIQSAIPTQKKNEAIEKPLSGTLEEYVDFIRNNIDHFIRTHESSFANYAQLKKAIDPRILVEELNREAKVPLKRHPYPNRIKVGSLDGDQESFVQMQTMVQVQTELLQEIKAQEVDQSLGYRRMYDTNISYHVNSLMECKTHPFVPLNLEHFDQEIYLSNNLTDQKVHYLIPNHFPSYEMIIGRDRQGVLKALLCSLEDQTRISSYTVFKARLSNDIEISQGHYLANQSYYNLYVQAKVLCGFSLFPTVLEQEALKAWIDRVGANNLRTIFEDKIYPVLSKARQEAYTNSQLRKYLNAH